jgi:DNA repair protein RecN (Recombination protein N)
VDIHGPHDHQSLLHSARQLDILDAFAGLEADRAAFQGLFRKKGALLAERAALVVDEQTYAQQLDLLRFQIHEITEARFQPEEEAELDSAHRRASNAVRLVELAQAALHVLSQADESALAQLGRAGRTLQELQRIDPTTAPLTELHAQAAQLLDDLRAATNRYLDGIETNPADLQVLEERLNLLQRLKRKYGPSVRDILEFAAEAQRKLTSLEQRDAELTRLRNELAQLDEDLRKAGAKLSARRQKAIPGLVKAVERELGVLGFRQSRFQVQFEGLPTEKEGAMPASPALSSSGFDKVEFLFAPNPGEPPRPLRAIASSGEMARVMLALKTALADQDEIPVLVFDEVDANVGGETASSVGERMRRIGRRHQVLCVTHLAPVAARADTHLVVSKEVRAGRTLSQVGELGASARAQELARMLGGPTDAALRHAKALLQAVE